MYKVIPKNGLKVINPDNMKKVSEDGAIIQRVTTYWRNREKDGDVTIEDLSKVKSSKVESKKIEEKK